MPQNAPLTIGLTGGIGSGKSTVCTLFKDQNIPIIDADQIAREVVQPGSVSLKTISEKLGAQFLTANGKLNRRLLRQVIFSDPVKKQTLEAILHPLIHQSIRTKIDAIKNDPLQNAPFIIVAIPLLVEGIKDQKKPNYLDEIWVIDCSVAKQLERAVGRDQQNTAQIQAIIDQQVGRETRLKWADRVIQNQAGLVELKQQVALIMDLFKTT